MVRPGQGKAAGCAEHPASSTNEWQFLLNVPQGGLHNVKIIWDAGRDNLLLTYVVPWR